MKNNDKRTKKDPKKLLLILPVCILLLFITLFVGASISRNHLRKELIEIKENTDKRGNDKSRLSVLEARNRTITYIIGRDEETEGLLEDLETSFSVTRFLFSVPSRFLPACPSESGCIDRIPSNNWRDPR